MACTLACPMLSTASDPTRTMMYRSKHPRALLLGPVVDVFRRQHFYLFLSLSVIVPVSCDDHSSDGEQSANKADLARIGADAEHGERLEHKAGDRKCDAITHATFLPYRPLLARRGSHFDLTSLPSSGVGAIWCDEICRRLDRACGPQLARDRQGRYLHVGPPRALAAMLVQSLVMRAAKGHDEFITDLMAEGPGLRKLRVMRVRGCSLADEAGVFAHKSEMRLAPLAWRPWGRRGYLPSPAWAG